MGIFTNKKLSENQVDNLNKLLPEQFQKPDWTENDFKGANSIYLRFSTHVNNLLNVYKEDNKVLKKKISNLDKVAVKNITIYNTEIFNAEPFGMVDIGIVKKFGTASTGDRFANGAIGYAIESAIDDTWAKNNEQENSVNEVKLKLLEKAKNIYPDCNLFFKYQVDFREIGSSGNVFIYMRGTAAKGENKALEIAVQNAKENIADFKEKMSKKKVEVERFLEIKDKIPQNPKQIEEFFGE